MKNLCLLMFLLVATLFLAAAVPVVAQERTEILPENVAWSYVFAKPTVKNWTTQFPLPNGQIHVGTITTGNVWPKDKPNIWATTRLTLPVDYKPGNLFLRYAHDDHIMIYINGEVVYQALGATWCEQLRVHKKNKLIPNILRPGENIIAILGYNIRESGEMHVTLFTDDRPPLSIESVLQADGKWSYTCQNPGAQWVKQFPLRGGKLGSAPFSTNLGGVWPEKERNIWMTQAVTLPKDYMPEEMIVQYLSDDILWLYVNGTLVLHVNRATSAEYWVFDRDAKNTLKPGRNTIAVRCENTGGGGFVGVDIFTRKYTDADKKNPLENLERQAPPEDMAAEMAAEEKELTETEKKIQQAMNCFKVGQDDLAVTMLEKAAEEDEKDFQANCILGIYALTKDYDRAKAFAYFQKCVKVDAKNPAVLNNYGVAAMENKKVIPALQAWERLAKLDATLPALGQNVGCLMDLMNKKRVTLQEAEQLRLVDLYIAVCTNQNRDRDPNCGFMLMPPQEGAGCRPDCDSVFVQEFKQGRTTVKCQPYEVRKTYYGK